MFLYDVITQWGAPGIPGEGGPFGYLLSLSLGIALEMINEGLPLPLLGELAAGGPV